MQTQDKPTLYDRLGGVYNIATVVDDLIDRVMVDSRLNANPRVDEAHHRVSPAGFKYFVTEMVYWAAGGPQQYSGRSMGDSHRHLMITEGEWQAFMDDFQQTLYGRGASHLSPSPVRTHRARLRQWAQDKIIHVPLEKAIANGGPVRRGADATV
jgi:hemoglobin